MSYFVSICLIVYNISVFLNNQRSFVTIRKKRHRVAILNSYLLQNHYIYSLLKLLIALLTSQKIYIIKIFSLPGDSYSVIIFEVYFKWANLVYIRSLFSAWHPWDSERGSGWAQGEPGKWVKCYLCVWKQT